MALKRLNTNLNYLNFRINMEFRKDFLFGSLLMLKSRSHFVLEYFIPKSAHFLEDRSHFLLNLKFAMIIPDLTACSIVNSDYLLEESHKYFETQKQFIDACLGC